MKTAIICRDLVERFAGSTIINASGIRSQEGPDRAKAPIFARELKLTSKTYGTTGLDWLVSAQMILGGIAIVIGLLVLTWIALLRILDRLHGI